MLEEATSFRLLEVLQLHLAAGKYYQSARNFSAISFRLKGNTVIRCEDGEFSLSNGDVFGVPEGKSYRIERGDEEIIVFHFQMIGAFDRVPFAIRGQEALLRPLFEKALTEYSEKEPGYYYRVCGIFAKIAETVYLSVGEKRNEQMQTAKRLFDRFFSDPDCTVASVGRQTGFSPAAFRKQFRQAFGMSPQEYLMQKRIDYACVLLSHKGILRTEVARRCGFRDEKYFGTLFKKKTGHTVREYGTDLQNRKNGAGNG